MFLKNLCGVTCAAHCIGDDHPILMYIGTIAVLCSSTYVTLLMMRRLVHRWERRIALRAATAVHREMSVAFPCMLEALGAHFVSTNATVNEDEDAVTDDAEDRRLAWARGWEEIHSVPGSPAATVRAALEWARPHPATALPWLQRLQRGVGRHVYIHSLRLLGAAEEARVTAAAEARLRRSIPRPVPARVLHAAIVRANDSIHSACTLVLVHRCEQFLTLTGVLARGDFGEVYTNADAPVRTRRSFFADSDADEGEPPGPNPSFAPV
jgi:hypothetical protein